MPPPRTRRSGALGAVLRSVLDVEVVLRVLFLPVHLDDVLGDRRLAELQEPRVAEILLGELRLTLAELVLEAGERRIATELDHELLDGAPEQLEGGVLVTRGGGEVHLRVAGGR